MKPQRTNTPEPAHGEVAKAQDLNLTANQILAAHQLARNCAAQSVLYAAKCGALMRNAKDQVGHGKFTAWLKKHCPSVSHRTSNHYMALAEKIEAQMHSKLPSTRNLTLLDLPDPRDLKDDGNHRVVAAVKKVTDNRTLSKLYVDLDIVRRNTKAENVKERLGARTGNREIDGAVEAKLFVDQVLEKIAARPVFDKHLEPLDRNRYVDALFTELRALGVPVSMQRAA